MLNEEQLRKCKDAFYVFERNMELVEKFTLLAEIREARMVFRERRLLPVLREEVGVIRKHLRDVYSVGLPMVLVFIVTCYEECLKEIYETLKGDKLTREESRAFFHPEKVRGLFYKIVKTDPLNGNNQLSRNTRIVIVKRNVIVHRAAKIDRKAEEELRTLDVTGYRKGQKLKLEAREVRGDAQTLKSYATMIFKSVNSYMTSSASMLH